MGRTNGLFILLATVVACGGWAMSYRTIGAYIRVSIELMQARIKEKIADAGRAVRKNRYGAGRATMRLEPTVAWSEGDPHPPEFLYGPDPGIEALEIISYMLKGLDKGLAELEERESNAWETTCDIADIVAYQGDLEFLAREYGRLEGELGLIAARVGNLEANAMVAGEQRFEMAGNAEKRLAILESKLKDATFIMYGGKPSVE